MKGYFASLAKQSGLRVSGRMPGGRVPPAPVDAPLHRDETVMVSPGESVRMENATAPRPPVQNTKAIKSRSGRTPDAAPPPPLVRETLPEATREREVSETGIPPKIEPISPEVRGITESRKIADPVVPPVKAISNDDSVAPEIITIERQEFVEQEPVSAPPVERVEIPESSEQITPEKTGQARFFVKTAEIIERGEADTADIGGILFQEVRQWVTSGPSEPELPAHERPETEMLTVKEIVREKSEPTIVIGETKTREMAETTAPLEEQNFNLSIGTISVIIEDAEKPVDPVRVIQGEGSQAANTTGSKRGFSRLSRNYL